MLSPYQLQENDAFSYEFSTDQGIRYKVYFLDYSFMFDNFPNINCPIYSFSIECIDGNPDYATGDDRIALTVARIIESFFANIMNVAIYVCDSMDDRQVARKRKFDLWFYRLNKGELLKEDGIAMVEGTTLYNAMLIHRQNPQLTEIISAFNELNERANEK